MPEREISEDDFARYFAHTPAALCVKECARLTVLRRYACVEPILDVGCGDGLFARMAFEGAEVWGIDIDAKEGRWAAASRAYSQVILGDVTRAKLPEAFFGTTVANCSLEHVPRVDLALANIRRSLKPGGTAYLFVPNKDWARQLVSYRLLAGAGFEDSAELLRASLDAFFRHHHLYDEDGWREVVAASGMQVVAVEPVLSTGTTVAFEALLVPSLLGWANKHLTTRWTNFPRFRRLLSRPVFNLVGGLLRASDPAPTAEFLVVARKA